MANDLSDLARELEEAPQVAGPAPGEDAPPGQGQGSQDQEPPPSGPPPRRPERRTAPCGRWHARPA